MGLLQRKRSYEILQKKSGINEGIKIAMNVKNVFLDIYHVLKAVVITLGVTIKTYIVINS